MPNVSGWPFDAKEARRRQLAGGAAELGVDLGGGVTLKLVRIPAGRFVMGSSKGELDEIPATAQVVGNGFWMGVCEVTNRQFGRFDSPHESGYARRFRTPSTERKSRPLNGPEQPVVRVSWPRAMEFCEWLSAKTAISFTLPTEVQWEYACRAGSGGDFSGIPAGSDSAEWFNAADLPLGWIGDLNFAEGSSVSVDVGGYRPNAWGLSDMHGNVAEWTRSAYAPYPYDKDDGRNNVESTGRKVVRGGSFYDRPRWCRSAFRQSYPAWQRVYNVGFRVVSEINP